MTDVRFASHPLDAKKYDTATLRKHFLIEDLLQPGKINAVYSMHDRMMTLGVVPTDGAIDLPVFEDVTKASYFLERRELGIINIGAAGTVEVDGTRYELANKECLYVGRGSQKVVFSSQDKESPSLFYISSSPAHASHPTTHAGVSDANQVHLGSGDNCNERTIYQFIHEEGIQSCQLVMGYTELKPGSIWNTFPPHTHHRRMEVYFYFDIPEDQAVVHFMGDPSETRHLVMRNHQGVISPEWSIHAGAGTAAYHFIWSMAGENKAFTDMDGVPLTQLL